VRRPSLILFYNPFFDQWPAIENLDCAEECRFTTDRAMLADADAVVFHLPSCDNIWAAPKYAGQAWVAWSMESTASCRDLADPDFMRAFDLTMTYRRDSDIWTPYFSARRARRLLGAVSAKTEAAPAVLFQSTPQDGDGRRAYLTELMRHLGVDSYGKVLRNRILAEPDLGYQTKRETIARYKFCLSFENTIEPDYVTEKFFDPLTVGTVPVYRGAPNIRDFAPGDDCFIDVRDFANPAELAAYLDHLDHDEAAYRRYFKWRERGVSERFQRLFAATERSSFCRLCDRVRQLADPRRKRGAPVRPLAWRRWIRLDESGRHAPIRAG